MAQLLLLAADVAERDLVGWLIFLAVGGLCGWVASILMGTNGQMGIIANVIVGIVGALLGAWLFGKLGWTFGGGQMGGVISAILGAAVLLLILKILRVYR